MLSIETILDRKTMTKIMRSGHSRIPIFDGPADQPLDQRNIIGVLLVKVRKLLTSAQPKIPPFLNPFFQSLILLDPDDNTPLKDVKLGTMTQISPKMNLFELLNVFQEGSSKCYNFNLHSLVLRKFKYKLKLSFP